MTKSEIKFTVTLDDNMVAEKIDWSASDANQHNTSKGVMISVWDAKENNFSSWDYDFDEEEESESNFSSKSLWD